jgi:hypothetical protein
MDNMQSVAEGAMELFAKMYQVEGRFKADTKECCIVAIDNTINALKMASHLTHIPDIHIEYQQKMKEYILNEL